MSCQYLHQVLLCLWVSVSRFHFQVNFLDDMLNTQVKIKRNCLNIVTALHVLLQSLSSSRMDSSGLRTNCDLSLKEGESCQVVLSAICDPLCEEVTLLKSCLFTYFP